MHPDCPVPSGCGQKARGRRSSACSFASRCDPEAGQHAAFNRGPMHASAVASPQTGPLLRAAACRLRCPVACQCAPDSVSRSVVRAGAPSGVWMRWHLGASAAAPANGPAANESQPPRYWPRAAPNSHPVLAATHRADIIETGSNSPLPAGRASGPRRPSTALQFNRHGAASRLLYFSPATAILALRMIPRMPNR